MMSEESSISSDLEAKQEQALAMILQGEKDVKIAASLGINRTTIYRWRKYDTEFMKALDERQTLMREAASNGLLELTEAALEAVREALKDDDNRVRLQAARMVLDMLKVNKPEEKQGTTVIDLLEEALRGIEPQLGLDKKL